MFRRKIKLLPYIRTDVHHLSPYGQQFYGWEITAFNIPALWNKSRGDGIKVAVIDTGCDLNHVDIKDNLLEGKNFVEKNQAPYDKNGHGTHVAGTIAAIDNGYGMTGVAPNAKIIPVKALNDKGEGNINDIAEAVKWSADVGADMITMSLGSPNSSSTLERAIKYASQKNVIVFCAAGNSGINTEIMYPAKYQDVIAIGAIDEQMERTYFTCSGEELDFLAPGQDIISCVPDNKYAMMSGTSMSNPFAVGAACLVASYRKSMGLQPLASYQDYIDYFKRKSLKLKDSRYNKKMYEGYGILYPYLDKH